MNTSMEESRRLLKASGDEMQVTETEFHVGNSFHFVLWNITWNTLTGDTGSTIPDVHHYITEAKAEVSLQRIFDSLDVSNLDCVDDLGYEEMAYFLLPNGRNWRCKFEVSKI